MIDAIPMRDNRWYPPLSVPARDRRNQFGTRQRRPDVVPVYRLKGSPSLDNL